jgi:hypothetical protein
VKIVEQQEGRIVVRGIGRASPRFGAAVVLISVVLALLGAREAGITCERTEASAHCDWYSGGLVYGGRGTLDASVVEQVRLQRDATDQVVGLRVTRSDGDAITLSVPFTDPERLIAAQPQFDAFFSESGAPHAALHLDARMPVLVLSAIGFLVGLLLAIVRRSRCLVVLDQNAAQITIRSRLLGSPTDHVLHLPLHDVASATVSSPREGRWQVVLRLEGGATRDLLPEAAWDRRTAESIVAFLS